MGSSDRVAGSFTIVGDSSAIALLRATLELVLYRVLSQLNSQTTLFFNGFPSPTVPVKFHDRPDAKEILPPPLYLQ